MDLLLEGIDSVNRTSVSPRKQRGAGRVIDGRLEGISQFLEVAVGDVVVGPIRHRIELNAVRELHLVSLAKFPELAVPLLNPSCLPRPQERVLGILVVRPLREPRREVV